MRKKVVIQSENNYIITLSAFKSTYFVSIYIDNLEIGTNS